MSAIEVVKQTSPVKDLRFGHGVAGLAASKLTPNSVTLLQGILFRCPGSKDPTANTKPVWVGRSGVTADSSANGGMPVVPGSSLFIPIDDPSELWVISTLANQDYAWLGV
jgi:hypothetical protein